MLPFILPDLNELYRQMCKLYAKINSPNNDTQPWLGWLWQVFTQPAAEAFQAGTKGIGFCFDFCYLLKMQAAF